MHAAYRVFKDGEMKTLCLIDGDQSRVVGEKFGLLSFSQFYNIYRIATIMRNEEWDSQSYLNATCRIFGVTSRFPSASTRGLLYHAKDQDDDL